MERTKLVTIITEAGLESSLLKDLERLDIPGYTITDARGRGSRGRRDGIWEEARNLRIECLCDAVLARSLSEHVMDSYSDDFAIVTYVSDVEVFRPQKFSADGQIPSQGDEE
jgi:nitrogen regulatory protein PII